uniref:Uncharacterized protein n=1 Tax=Arundo donax TaxID=35708 RepID=A0A0A9BHY7_ARUDO
MTLNICFK